MFVRDTVVDATRLRVRRSRSRGVALRLVAMFVAGMMVTPALDTSPRWRMHSPYHSPRRRHYEISPRKTTLEPLETSHKFKAPTPTTTYKFPARSSPFGHSPRMISPLTLPLTPRQSPEDSVRGGLSTLESPRHDPSLPGQSPPSSPLSPFDLSKASPNLDQPSRYLNSDRSPSPPPDNRFMRTIGRQGTDDHRNAIGLAGAPVARVLHPERSDSRGSFRIVKNIHETNGANVLGMGTFKAPPFRSILDDLDVPSPRLTQRVPISLATASVHSSHCVACALCVWCRCLRTCTRQFATAASSAPAPRTPRGGGLACRRRGSTPTPSLAQSGACASPHAPPRAAEATPRPRERPRPLKGPRSMPNTHASDR